MTANIFRRTSKFFQYTENVYLSGWGEPLLNPLFPSMIETAKKEGCRVGFTTNGALVNDTIAEKIVSLETDLICFSFAGSIAETHEMIRAGSSFERLMRNIRSIVGLKRELKHDKPRILLLYMMTQQNMKELPHSVDLAADAGANGVVATNLDYVAVPLQDKLKAFSCDKADSWFVSLVSESYRRADDRNISFHAFPIEMKPVRVCSENPLSNLYISEDGGVSPCVYLNPPTEEITRIFCGRKESISRVRFGNINNQSLLEIWKSPEYALFRSSYAKRRDSPEAFDTIPPACRTCYKAYGI